LQLQKQKEPSTFPSELAKKQSSELTGWSTLRLCLYLSSSTLYKTQISHALLQGKKKQIKGSLVSITQISHAPPLSSRKEETPTHKGIDALVSTTLKSHMHLLLFKKRKEPNTTQQTHKVQSCRGLINTIRSHKLSLLEEAPPKKKKTPQHTKNQTSEEREGSSFFPLLVLDNLLLVLLLSSSSSSTTTTTENQQSKVGK
jgi:hypothetical protein